MNRVQSIISTLIGLLVLVLLAVGLAWLLKAQQKLPTSQAVASQEGATPSQDSPLPIPTLVLTPPTPEYPPDYEGPGMPMRTPIPTPTVPPVPTPLPTPVVTPLPLASPPFIPGLEAVTPQPFHIIVREGNKVWIMNDDGSDRRLLIDTEAKAELLLGYIPPLYGEVNLSWGNLSPDGATLALVVADAQQVRAEGEHIELGIYLFEETTGALRKLVAGSEPVWSPDGSRIAYRGPGPDYGLWVADVKSGETRQLYAITAEVGVVMDIAWSPDGSKIVFLQGDPLPGGEAEMLVMAADGSEKPLQLLPPDDDFGFPAWSPDSNAISFISYAGEHSGPDESLSVCVVSPDGSRQVQLTKGLSVGGGLPRWSPDGKWLVFSAYQQYVQPEAQYDLWLVRSDGSELIRLTEDAVTDLEPYWSPDGAQIVFQRKGAGIWVLKLADGSQRPVYPASAEVTYYDIAIPGRAQ